MTDPVVEAFIARAVAYAWHGGQWSPLYALASSGLVRDPQAVFGELRERMVGASALDRAELEFLEQFVRENLTAPDRDGGYWRAPWAN